MKTIKTLAALRNYSASSIFSNKGPNPYVQLTMNPQEHYTLCDHQLEDSVLRYQQPLKEGISLAVYNGEELIFTHSGHWLHPLFAFEEFLLTYEGPREALSVHDSVAGKAAAVLQGRLGIKRAHIDLVSELAVAHYKNKGIELTWGEKIEKIACQTEALLSELDDEDEIYRILKERAGRSLTSV